MLAGNMAMEQENADDRRDLPAWRFVFESYVRISHVRWLNPPVEVDLTDMSERKHPLA